MKILVVRDSATKIPKEVSTLEEAQAFVSMGFHVTAETSSGHVPLDRIAEVVDGEPVLRAEEPVDAEPAEVSAKKVPAKKVPAKKAKR